MLVLPVGMATPLTGVVWCTFQRLGSSRDWDKAVLPTPLGSFSLGPWVVWLSGMIQKKASDELRSEWVIECIGERPGASFKARHWEI